METIEAPSALPMESATPDQSTLNGISVSESPVIGEPRPWRWTVEEFHRLDETGAFDNHRVALIEGEIIAMMTMGSLHVTGVTMATDVAREIFGSDFVIRVQAPLRLDDGNDPEPDIAVVRGHKRDFRQSHPTTAALVIEISDSTLNYDRGVKASIYARAAIADYWIVNVQHERLEIYRAPIEDPTAPFGWNYSEIKVLLSGASIAPLHAPDQSISIAVSDLLP